MSPPRKDPITDQDKNTLGLKKYQCLPAHLPPFSYVIKALRNEANDDNPETTDTSHTGEDDRSRSNRDDSIEYVKSTKNKNDDDE